MSNKIHITFNNGEEGDYESGISLLELSKYYQKEMDNPIIAAKINNIVFSLNEKIKKDVQVDFIDVNDINGQSMYLAALKFVFLVALKEIYGETADAYYLNSLDKGLYTEVIIDQKLNETEINKIKDKMLEIINLDLTFEKITPTKKEAVNYLYRIKEIEKAKNIQNISNSNVVFYKLKSFINYFYVDLPTSTGVINKFDLKLIDLNHLVILYPNARSNDEIPNYIHYDKTLNAFNNYRSWLKLVNASYVPELNDIVSSGKVNEFILMNKLYLDRQLTRISDEISAHKNIRLILIAGPSSSGKTTSSHRISLYLKSAGFNPILISADNYYKERVDSPKDENGEYDYECIEALDLEMFNRDLKTLLDGKEVIMPKFNFYTGKKEFNGKRLRLKDNDILIIEGLHCLNDKLTESIPKENKYKIYVSPFIAMRLDKHNHISTVDLRLLRRIVRDSIYRGYSVADTISGWQKVRKGEEKYIFPFQNEANIILNTASAYELGVLKVFAEPLLYSVPVNSPYYEESRRLLGNLRAYFPISSEKVPVDSVLREFIGGSIFDPH